MAEKIQAASGGDLVANVATAFTFDAGVNRVVIQPHPAAASKIWAKFNAASAALNDYHLCAAPGQVIEIRFQSPLTALALFSDGNLSYGTDFVIWGT